MRNPERVQQEMANSIAIDQMYRESERFLKEQEPDPDDFSGVYSQEEINRDKFETSRLEEIFRANLQELGEGGQRAHKLAKIFEGVFLKHAELGNWFGENVFISKTSRFDDFKNGIDNVLEVQEDKEVSHTALSIDVTIGGDMGTINSKVRRIKEQIKAGKMGEVKYFQSEATGYKGVLAGLPRVVINVDGRTVQELGEMSMENRKKEIGNHPIQMEILENLLEQMIELEEYARGENQIEIAETYTKSRLVLEGIYREKVGEKEEAI